MKEEYLHLLWKLKRIPITQLKLSDGRPLEVLDFGWYNTASGPDFFNGKIKIDGIIWSGNIEMHVNSSDWFAHQHQFDPAYDNVILHVVFHHDREVIVNHEALPTLELKTLIDEQHYFQYQQLNLANTWIACEKKLSSIKPITIQQQLENALAMRLERKAKLLQVQLKTLRGDELQLIYELIARVFGLKVNELPFMELCKKLPFYLLKNKTLNEIQFLLLGVAGLIPSDKEWMYLKQKYELTAMNPYSWKKKGLRPPSFPEKMINKFAVICHELINLTFENEDTFKHLNYSKSFENLLIINVQSIYLWWKGKNTNNLNLQEKALLLLEQTPSETNVIVTNWKKLGIKAISAFESQALLELKNEHCAQKKCLSCKIGIENLKNTGY
jgi:hypothetical protein